jgi:hypothetical protein
LRVTSSSAPLYDRKRQPKAKAALAAAATATVNPKIESHDSPDESLRPCAPSPKASRPRDSSRPSPEPRTIRSSSIDDPSPIQARNQKKKSYRRSKASSPNDVVPHRRQQRRKKGTTSESYSEEEEVHDEVKVEVKSRSRSARKTKVREAKAATSRPDPKAPKAPMCRVHRKTGIKFDSLTPTCTLKHAMTFTRVVTLEQFCEPKCRDCLIPIGANDVCCVCFRCDPLHLLCIECTFAASSDRVQIN